MQHLAFVISHRFAAPPQRVFQAWTDAAQLQQWFGPAGCSVPVCQLDLRAGGQCHYALQLPDGQRMWGLWRYLAVDAPHRIELVQQFSNADGGLGVHPFSPHWPRWTHSVTTLEADGDGTLMHIHCQPYQASDMERQTFDGARAGMAQGWAGTLQQLEAFLARPSAASAPVAAAASTSTFAAH